MQTTARWVLAAMLIGCGGGEGPGGPDGMGMSDGMKKKAEPVTVVELDEVRMGEVAQVIASSAAVESESAADLIPSSGGVVVSLHKDEGDLVKKGDLLAVLENVSLGAGAERAGSDLRRLEGQYTKLKDLASRGAVSDRELSDAFYQLETARSSAREASHSFGNTRLTAPFDGVVASRNVRVGQLAGSGTAAFQVVDLHKLRVVTQMPERDLNQVKVGQPAMLTSAYDDTRQASGIVQRIAPVVDASSGTFRVTIEVDSEQKVLRPGQFVTVDLEVDRRKDVLVVPRSAIVYEDGAPVIYRYALPEDEEDEDDEDDEESGDEDEDEADDEASADWWSSLFGGGDEEVDADAEADEEEPEVYHVADRVSVELGLLDHDTAQILSGLDDGDRIIVVGQSHLRDGARVRDVEEPVPEDDDGDDDDDDKEDDEANANGKPSSDKG